MEALEEAEAAEGTPAAENASKDGRELAFFFKDKRARVERDIKKEDFNSNFTVNSPNPTSPPTRSQNACLRETNPKKKRGRTFHHKRATVRFDT